MALGINTNIINDGDQYLLDAKNVKGGYVVVSDTTELNNLPTATIVKGSLAYSQSDEKFYLFNGSTWNEANFGGSVERHIFTINQRIQFTCEVAGIGSDVNIDVQPQIKYFLEGDDTEILTNLNNAITMLNYMLAQQGAPISFNPIAAISDYPAKFAEIQATLKQLALGSYIDAYTYTSIMSFLLYMPIGNLDLQDTNYIQNVFNNIYNGVYKVTANAIVYDVASTCYKHTSVQIWVYGNLPVIGSLESAAVGVDYFSDGEVFVSMDYPIPISVDYRNPDITITYIKQ